MSGLEELLARGLAKAVANGDYDTSLQEPLKHLRKAMTPRERMHAMAELDAQLASVGAKTAPEKAMRATLDAVKNALPLLMMNSDVSDAAFVGAWPPVAQTLLDTKLPNEFHMEMMVLYTDCMLSRRGSQPAKKLMQEAKLAATMFRSIGCGPLAATAAAAAAGEE